MIPKGSTTDVYLYIVRSRLGTATRLQLTQVSMT